MLRCSRKNSKKSFSFHTTLTLIQSQTISSNYGVYFQQNSKKENKMTDIPKNDKNVIYFFGMNFHLIFLFFQLIVPPSWIVKVPRKSSFKSSLKNSPNKKKKKAALTNNANEDISEEPSDKSEKPFCLKPIPSPGIAPILGT